MTKTTFLISCMTQINKDKRALRNIYIIKNESLSVCLDHLNSSTDFSGVFSNRLNNSRGMFMCVTHVYTTTTEERIWDLQRHP